MADLAPPTILPVSVCNKTVWLDNLVSRLGMPVTAVIEMNGLVIGSAIVRATSMEIPLTTSLKRGATIRARQWANGFDGELTPELLAVTVAPPPSSADDIGAPVLRAPFYECSLCARFDGVYPGATVTLYDEHGNVVGAAPGVGGTAIVSFASPLQGSWLLGSVSKAMQLVCGIPGPSVTLPPPLAAPTKAPLPRLRTPLRRCQPSLDVSALLAGARLEVHVPFSITSLHPVPLHSIATAPCASSDIGTLTGLPDLDSGDLVSVRQTLDGCSAPSDLATLPVLDLAPAPPVLHSYCLGDRCVRISNLAADAIVEVQFGNETFLAQASGNSYDMPVPDEFELLEGQIRARQRFNISDYRCWSEFSTPALLSTPLGEATGLPIIQTPVHVCATVVRVGGVVPGHRISIVASDLNDPKVGWEIGFAWSTDTQVDIGVNATFMRPGRAIRPVEFDCGLPTVGPSISFGSQARGFLDNRKPPLPSDLETLLEGLMPTFQFGSKQVLEAPVLNDPIHDCGAIHVSNIVPGALIDFYRLVSKTQQSPIPAHLEWLMTVPSPTSTLSVMQPMRLQSGDTVFAQQRICEMVSAQSAPVQVVPGKVERIAINVMCTSNGTAAPLTSDEVNVGTDLGIPVEHNGNTYLFFGDAFEGTVKPIFRIQGPPDPCPTLVGWECAMEGRPFQSLMVEGLPLARPFQVPSGAFSYDGRMYVFVTKTIPGSAVLGSSDPNPDVMASSYLVSATDDCQFFRQEFGGEPVDTWQAGDPSPDWWLRFINVCPVVISNADWPGLPSNTGDGLLLFGTGTYRKSDVYLAWVPLTPGQPIPRPSEWWFLTLRSPLPNFTQGAMRKSVGLLGVADWGELSVAWVPGLNRWIMLGFSPTDPNERAIVAFLARSPWGPWDQQISIWRADEDGDLGMNVVSPPYGNYIIDKFTTADMSTGTVDVYFIVSFNDINVANLPQFYGTYLAHAKLRCAP